MDLDGVYASLCFPSLIAGFAGTVFSASKDQELGLGVVAGVERLAHRGVGRPAPGPRDPAAARLARRPGGRGRPTSAPTRRAGFKAVSFPENPVDLELPSIHTDHWDPVLRACEETETVLCLHNGSSSWTAARSPGAPLALYTSLFPVNALVTAADWLWARIPTRFPDIKIAFSEGGISWVPMLIDRISYVLDHSAVGARRLGRSRRLADRRAAPQLLVLRDRPRLDDRVARAHRHRPHLHRERLSARRLDVARHAGAGARRPRRAARPTRSAS